MGSNVIHQHEGWKKLWKLNIPHKVKIFLWRFCRNTMPIRWRLRSRGIIVPITCPMCNNDVEHMLHLFFDCNFAADCWAHANIMQDMTEVEAAPSWLLDKLATASVEELEKISMVLWGIWNWRNRKVWDNKSVTGAFAMDESFKTLTTWREARKIVKSTVPVSQRTEECSKWRPPEQGGFKINVDASVMPGVNSFSIGMVLRGHDGVFVAGKTSRFSVADSVFEAESIGVREALSWIYDNNL